MTFTVTSGASVHTNHVAVLQFRPSGTSSAHASITGSYVEMELLKRKNIVLLERGQVKKKYRIADADSYSCQDSSCAVLAGRELSADYVILGDVVKNSRYSIKVKVVSVPKEKVAFTCSVQYDREDEARNAAVKMAKKILTGLKDYDTASDIPDDSGNGSDGERGREIRTGIDLFIPAGRLGDLIKPGAGLNCGVSFPGIAKGLPGPLKRITPGFETGFFYSSGRINSDDSGLLVPLSFSFGYPLNVIERVYLMPVITAGFTYIRFHHAEGYGFNMQDNSSVWSIDPHTGLKLVAGRPLSDNICIELSAGLMVMIETPEPQLIASARLGLLYRFDDM